MASSGDADVGLRLRLFGRSEVRKDLRDTADDLDETGKRAQTLGDKAVGAAKGLAEMVDSRFERGLRGLHDSAKVAGVGLAKGLAAGVALAGAAVGAALAGAVAKGIEQQGSSTSLQAQLGLTPDQAAEAGAIAGRIYAQNYGESREQVSDALASLSRSSGLDVTSAEIQDAARYALDLASAFDVDVSESARAAGQLVRTNLVDNLTEAYNLLTAGFQNGADRGDDFLDTLNEYSSTFRDLGLNGEQSVGLITQALDAGVGTSDFAADSLRELGTRITAGGSAIDEALQSIGLNAGDIEKGFNAGGSAAEKSLDQVFDALRGTKDAQVQTTAGAALLGSQYEDIGNALLAMDPSTAVSALGDVNGAASSLDAALSTGIGPSLESVKRGFEGIVTGAGAALVEKWGPSVEGVLDRISGGLTTLGTDLPGLGADLMTLVSDGDLTALGGRLETAFGLPAGTITDLQSKLDTLVAFVRDRLLPVVSSIVAGLTQFAEHKINTVLPIVTAAMGFLADHTDGVKRAVYGVLVAWGIYRGVMTAVKIATTLHTTALAANTFAQKLSQSTVGTWLGVKGLELIAWVRTTAAMVLQKAALFATGVATKAAAAGQWLLNAAMSANPIGLVIAAIALLVGGLIWFFTKTETGQKIFAAAWGGIKDAAQWVADWFMGTLVPFLGGVWDSITGGISAAWTWMRDVLWPGIVGVWNGIKSGISDAVSAAIDFVRDHWQLILSIITGPVGAAVIQLATHWSDIQEGARKAFDAVKGFIQHPLDTIQTLLDKLGDLGNKLTGGALGKVGSFLGLDGAAADGGTIRAGQTFLVGERGPELFTAGTSGTILPSEALSAMMTADVPSVGSTPTPSSDLGDDDAGIPDGMATLSLTIPVVIDGREVARATVNGMHANAAWT